MKLLLVFVFLAFICMTRSAPTSSSTTGRQLIFEHYDQDQVHGDVIHKDNADDDDDDDEEEEEKIDIITTTTTTTRRSPFALPTRNRNLMPSKPPIQTQRTTTRRTTRAPVDDDQAESINDYDGDFKYVQNFRKYVQQLMEDIRKLVQNLTGYDVVHIIQRQKYPQTDE